MERGNLVTQLAMNQEDNGKLQILILAVVDIKTQKPKKEVF